MGLSEPTYSQFLETISDAAIVVERARTIALANSLAHVVFGYQPGELAALHIEDLIPETRRGGKLGGLLFTSMTRPIGTVEQLTARRKDGSGFPVDIMLKPIVLEGRRCIVCILRDITDRIEAERVLRESEARYRQLFGSTLSGFALHDIICDEAGKPKDYRFLDVNPAFERLTNLKAADLIGRTVLEVLPDTESVWIERYGAVALTGEPAHFTNYSRALGRYYEVTAYSPFKGQFAVFFEDRTEEYRAKERIETQLRRLAALHAIDTAITSSYDLRLTQSVILEHTTAQLGMDAASLLLLDPYTQVLTYAAGRGFRTRAIEQTRVKPGEGISGKSILERRVVHTQNPAQSADFTRRALVADEHFLEYFAAPLIAKGRVVGILEVFHRSPVEPDDDWQAFLEMLAGQAAIAVDNALLTESMQRSNTELVLAYDATIEGWSRALDLRDEETEGHTQRVTEFTERLAQAKGLNDADLVHIRRGALLHDIGKMGVPDKILLKPDKLNEEEWVIMRKHPDIAFGLLAPITYLRPALDIPYCHHEKWDGTGYPRGLKGRRIPLAARLFAVVDVWDALLSDRPYRAGWPEEKVLEHIRSLSGTHFDPEAVDLFLRVIGEQR